MSSFERGNEMMDFAIIPRDSDDIESHEWWVVFYEIDV